MPIRNSARCHVLNRSTTNLGVNEAPHLYEQFINDNNRCGIITVCIWNSSPSSWRVVSLCVSSHTCRPTITIFDALSICNAQRVSAAYRIRMPCHTLVFCGKRLHVSSTIFHNMVAPWLFFTTYWLGKIPIGSVNRGWIHVTCKKFAIFDQYIAIISLIHQAGSNKRKIQIKCKISKLQ